MRLSSGSKKVAYYVDTFVEVPVEEFRRAHPYGFLIQLSQRFLDKSPASQFFTQVLDDQSILEKLKQKKVHTDVMEATVLEIRIKKSVTDSETISIGRSPLSDIVIDNKLVSRNHAYLNLSPSSETCYLVDTGAANGTFLNGEKMTPQNKYQLTSSNEISFGPEIKILYFSSEAFHSFLSNLQSPQTDVP